METGANDVYIVEEKDGREALLPAIGDRIPDVDEGSDDGARPGIPAP